MGDDFRFNDLDLQWVSNITTNRYEIKVRAILGTERHDDKEVRILNRKLRWGADRITHEGDEKHVHTVIRGMGLHDDSRGLVIPVVREAEDVTEGSELDSGEASTYRQ